MNHIIREVQEKDHSLNRIEVSKSRVLKNAKLLKEYNLHIAIAPVLKSFAYGHGIGIVGPLLDTLGFPFFCVNSLYEANLMREAGVKTEILIMGYVDPAAVQDASFDYTIALFDIEQARTLQALNKKLKVHLNVETGLHREGVDFLRFDSLLAEVKECTNLDVTGLMSHLATSNEPEGETTRMQLAGFAKAKELVAQAGLQPKWFHLGGTLALLNDLSDTCNVIRCGKAFFGIALNISYQGSQTAEETKPVLKEFQPTMNVKTKIVQVKKIQKGDHVSYADLYTAEKDMVIGILPFGYYDGFDRRLSNKGVVLVDGKPCKVLGVIAMNVSVIDLTDIPDAHVGQDVTIYSQNAEDPNSLDTSAQLCATLPQDLLVHLAQTMPRELID